VISPPPKRGELHFVDLDPVVGSEQAGRRPFLVISVGAMNESQVQMAIGLPLTSTPRDNALHVRLEPGPTGLERVSYAMPEMVRSISILRFHRRLGRAPADALETAATNLAVLVGLGRTKF
jgi:mRNA interferase MazF